MNTAYKNRRMHWFGVPKWRIEAATWYKWVLHLHLPYLRFVISLDNEINTKGAVPIISWISNVFAAIVDLNHLEFATSLILLFFFFHLWFFFRCAFHFSSICCCCFFCSHFRSWLLLWLFRCCFPIRLCSLQNFAPDIETVVPSRVRRFYFSCSLCVCVF